MLKKFFKSEDGSSFIELALIVPVVFVPLLFGIIDLGKLTNTRIALLDAAHAAAQYGSMSPDLRLGGMNSVSKGMLTKTIGTLSNGRDPHVSYHPVEYCVCYKTVTHLQNYNCTPTTIPQGTVCNGSGDHIVYIVQQQIEYYYQPMFPALFKALGVIDSETDGMRLYANVYIQSQSQS